MVLRGLHLGGGGGRNWSDQSHEVSPPPTQKWPQSLSPCLYNIPNMLTIALQPSRSPLPAGTKEQEGRPWPGFPVHASFPLQIRRSCQECHLQK